MSRQSSHVTATRTRDAEEKRECEAETDSFNASWEIEKAETTHEVLSNRGFDWKEETLRIESQIEETMLEIAPLVMEAAMSPIRVRETRAQEIRGKKIRKQYNTIIMMEMRRQLILDLIGETPES
jgi:hypothetical protein